jgi:hypothetical protein
VVPVQTASQSCLAKEVTPLILDRYSATKLPTVWMRKMRSSIVAVSDARPPGKGRWKTVVVVLVMVVVDEVVLVGMHGGSPVVEVVVISVLVVVGATVVVVVSNVEEVVVYGSTVVVVVANVVVVLNSGPHQLQTTDALVSHVASFNRQVS